MSIHALYFGVSKGSARDFLSSEKGPPTPPRHHRTEAQRCCVYSATAARSAFFGLALVGPCFIHSFSIAKAAAASEAKETPPSL